MRLPKESELFMEQIYWFLEGVEYDDDPIPFLEEMVNYLDNGEVEGVPDTHLAAMRQHATALLKSKRQLIIEAADISRQ